MRLTFVRRACRYRFHAARRDVRKRFVPRPCCDVVKRDDVMCFLRFNRPSSRDHVRPVAVSVGRPNFFETRSGRPRGPPTGVVRLCGRTVENIFADRPSQKTRRNERIVTGVAQSASRKTTFPVGRFRFRNEPFVFPS